MFWGYYPKIQQRQGATSSRIRPSPACGRARAPVLGPKPWSPSTFQPWLRPWLSTTVDGATTVDGRRRSNAVDDVFVGVQWRRGLPSTTD